MFLFGESTRTRASEIGKKPCVLCGLDQSFTLIEESNWFSVFMLPLAKVENTARYWQCEHCGTSFEPDNAEEPAAETILKKTIVYILMGYEQENQMKTAADICLKISNRPFSEDQIRQMIADISAHRPDLVAELRAMSLHINLQGKQQIIAAAFLTTHICCELEYEDRLRINLMGNALDVGLEFVQHTIDGVRQHNYYGVNRLP